MTAASGSKPALLKQVLDQALAGDDEPVPVADRPWFRPVWDAATPAATLDAYADVCMLIGARGADLRDGAADAAPETAELWRTVRANRRAGARMVVDHLVALGPLRPGLGVERAADVLWTFNDPAHYGALVHESGWPEPEFRDWLAGVMRATLLPGSAG
ncbi:hypothetical protein ABTW95_25155 [Spirillospora sp. NPDC127506]